MLIVAIMVIVGLMSGVLSNTGTAAVLIPVVIGIAAKSGYKRSKLLMPILIAGILFYATIGYKLLPECDPKEEEAFDTKRDFDQVPKWKQWMSLIILILTLLAMIFEEKIGISLCVSGGIGALLLILTGVISEKDALKSIDLKTIFLFGGTLSLAAALEKTGAGDDRRKSNWSTWKRSVSIYSDAGRISSVLCDDKFYVKHSDDSIDGSDLSVDCTENRSRSESSIDGMCNRRFLCLCNSDRNAGKYYGCGSRRLPLYGFCKSRISIDYHSNGCEYDYPPDCISILSIKG